MYYSFRCTYCGRLFYTYDTSRERASRTLYFTVKQHLIDYDEDRKEHEMDDGEQVDSDQIYSEMREYNSPPAGAYEATVTSGDTSSSSVKSNNSVLLVVIAVILALLIIVAICLIFFYPAVSAIIQLFLP